MKEISQNHRAVVDALISGMTNDEACLAVYPHRSEWTKKAREIAVSKVLKLPHVRAYYEEQRAILDEEKARAAREEALWSMRESVDTLKFVIKMAQKDAVEITKRNQDGGAYERVMPTATANAITGAVNALNRMFGIADQPQKSDDTLNVSFIDDLGSGVKDE